MEKCANFALIFFERKQRHKALKKALNSSTKVRFKSEPNIHKICDKNEANHLINLALRNSSAEVEGNGPPPLPLPRPQGPLGLGSQPNLHQCPGSQDLHINALASSVQAPGTCTLPRRSTTRNEQSERFRSPSNPPPTSRIPPPYSRHQPPEPFGRLKRPCQPPPPPRVPQGAVQFPQIQYPQHHGSAQDLDHRISPLENGQKPLSEEGSSLPVDWSLRNLDSSGADGGSLRRSETAAAAAPASVECSNANSCTRNYKIPNQNEMVDSSFPSKSTEDLLNASRVPREVAIEPQNFKRPCVNGSHVMRAENEVISSDSIYPNGGHFSVHNEREMDATMRQGSPVKGQSYYVGLHPNSKDPGKMTQVQNGNPEMSTFKPPKEINQRMVDTLPRSCPKEKQIKNYINGNQSNSLCRNGNIFKSYGYPPESSANNQNYVNEPELYITEKDDRFEDREKNGCQDNRFGENGNSRSWKEETRLCENGRMKCYPGAADSLVVRDHQSFYNGERSNTKGGYEAKETELDREEGRKGDGCTSCPSSSSAASSSWMEWTQQLQAYVAWVNSQLRKKPDKQLITDLRRDFQNGVVFADLIEIIAGEKVAGINRDGESFQLRRENLDRVLLFMAAKRIRMTHITSKEIAEGNLKSIMRVILALAAHYKPQSVKEGTAAASGAKGDEGVETDARSDNQCRQSSNNQLQETKNQQQQQQQSLSQRPQLHKQQQSQQNHQTLPVQSRKPQRPATVIMHDVGVGPDTPLSGPNKTPSLMRRSIDGGEEPGSRGSLSLRRHPSLTSNVTRPSSPSAPVYENLPRRTGQNRWAYDSLRASHKFCWNSSPEESRSSKHPSVAETKEDSFTAGGSSLDSSIDCDVDLTKDSSSSSSLSCRNPQSKPAALEFWQELQVTDRTVAVSKTEGDADGDNPFKYHTIHRMSGRRKLPQIPGHSSSPTGSGHSRGATPVGPNHSAHQSSDLPPRSASTGREDPLNSTFRGNVGGHNSDDSSREPEGRSQNSSPATSVARGPVLDSWRELVGLEASIDELKDQLKDHLKGQEQLKDTSTPFHLFRSTTVDCGDETAAKNDDVTADGSASALRQEVLKHIIARRSLENEKAELTRHLAQRDGLICDLRKQLIQREKAFQQQRNQFEEAIRNVQNGKPYRPFRGESPTMGRTQGREELQLVREAISALRGNFRGTDPNQHTLDTLEQAIAVLMERNSITNGDTNCVGLTKKEKRSLNAQNDSYTKVIYFTDRTVTPFMTCISKRLGEVTLRDFKSIFDRSGNFRFHFKSHDPEYGLVKEEIMNDDDILPGVEGKIIAWVEEDLE